MCLTCHALIAFAQKVIGYFINKAYDQIHKQQQHTHRRCWRYFSSALHADDHG